MSKDLMDLIHEINVVGQASARRRKAMQDLLVSHHYALKHALSTGNVKNIEEIRLQCIGAYTAIIDDTISYSAKADNLETRLNDITSGKK